MTSVQPSKWDSSWTCPNCRPFDDPPFFCPEHSEAAQTILELRRYVETGKASKAVRTLQRAEGKRVVREQEKERPHPIGACHYVYAMRAIGFEKEYLICGRPQRDKKWPAGERKIPWRIQYCEAHFKQYRNLRMGSRNPRPVLPDSASAVWVVGFPKLHRGKKEKPRRGGFWGVPFEPNWNLGRSDLRHEYDD
jgi:hypothetical protein